MMETRGCGLCADCAGISTSSPAAEVKRTARESPYMTAEATTLRRDVTARGLTRFFQVIVCLPLLLTYVPRSLTSRLGICPRAIAVPVERLLLTHTFAPVARGFAGQLP